MVLTDESADVGALFAVTLAVSVLGNDELARPVTVRVKTRSVPAVTCGIVTVGLAIESLSNVTVTPVVGVVSAQE